MAATIEGLRERIEVALGSLDDADLRALLEELQPYDIASALAHLADPERARVLTALPVERVAETLEHLDFDEQYHLLMNTLDDQRSRDVLLSMEPDSLVDLLGAVHAREAAELLRRLPEEDLREVRQLMTYPESSAGGRMTTEYIAVRRQWTAEQVLAHFRRVGRDVEIAHYVYVVDRDGRLVGVTSMRSVLLAEPRTPLDEFISTNVVSVSALADQEEAANLLKQYDFGALPVVDGGGRLVGVLSVDDILDVAEEEATEDIHKSASVAPLKVSYTRAGPLMLYHRRIWWLSGLVVMNVLTVSVLAIYARTLEAAIALAFFIPLLIGSGGNTGSQSATLMIRALATNDLQMGEWARTLGKELAVGILLGLSLGALALVLGLLLQVGPQIGLVVGATMVLLVLVANLIGMSLPFLLSRLNFDPAVASAPLIASIMDVTGLLIYFQVARVVLGS